MSTNFYLENNISTLLDVVAGYFNLSREALEDFEINRPTYGSVLELFNKICEKFTEEDYGVNVDKMMVVHSEFNNIIRNTPTCRSYLEQRMKQINKNTIPQEDERRFSDVLCLIIRSQNKF